MAALYRKFAEDWRSRPERRFDANNYPFPPKENRNPPQHELHCVTWFNCDRLKSEIAERVSVLCVPTRRGWEAPAHLFYETMGFERPPQVHVVALKWLNDHFGAELVGLEDRVLEVAPGSRPSDPISALRAAAWLGAYSFCPVTSQNESASTEELAVYLMESAFWSFCWP